MAAEGGVGKVNDDPAVEPILGQGRQQRVQIHGAAVWVGPYGPDSTSRRGRSSPAGGSVPQIVQWGQSEAGKLTIDS